MKLSPRILVGWLAVISWAPAQQLIYGVSGVSGSAFGAAVANVGDVDGDALDDLLIGAADANRARLVSGADGSTLRTHLGGGSASARFGYAVGSVGDVDLDGYGDYLIGDPDAITGASAGTVRLFSGIDGHVIRTHQGVVGSEFGFTVRAVGDTNLDGWPDYAIGERFNAVGLIPRGRFAVYSGRDGAELMADVGHNGLAQLGFGIDGIGDVNGDCYEDVVVSEPGFGQVLVYSGLDSSILRTLPQAFGYFFWGSRVCGLGDVDGDGIPDLAAATVDGAGLVRIFSGADGGLLRELTGGALDDEFGASIAALGDVDHDGCADFAIGAPGADGPGLDAGQVTVFSGRSATEILAFEGSAAGGRFGTAIAALGDLHADGHREIAIGAPGSTAGGEVLVYSMSLVAFPARTWYSVSGCPTQAGGLPRLHLSNEALLGDSIDLVVTGAPAGSVGVINLGFRWDLNPGAVAPGCILHAYPLLSLSTSFDPRGKAAASFVLPGNATLAGARLSWQAIAVDLGNNALNIATSNGARTRLGLAPRRIDVTPVNDGIVAADGATGSGYIMYSEEDVYVRFAANPVFAGAATHLVAVVFDASSGVWMYDTNDSYVPFVPRATDLLLAQVDFSADTATELAGSVGEIEGIASGYQSGDIQVIPNAWQGGRNLGEFGVSGTFVLR